MKYFFYLFFIIIFLGNCDSKSSKKTIAKKEICICIQPFENVDTMYVQSSKKALMTQYEKKVEILPAIPLPDIAKNQKIEALKNYPLRYRADTLIRFLLRILPKKCDYIVGLTNEDITCTNKDEKGKILEPQWANIDWGIFGLGFQPGKSCIVSYFRLSFGTSDKNLIASRVRKTITHELGHNFGLKHCKQEKCNMNEAPPINALAATDTESETVCKKCRMKLR